MAKSDTSFDKDNQPKGRKPRGKSERTKILDAMKRGERSEGEFYDLLITKAFDPKDLFGFGELLKRISPIHKSTYACMSFDFEKGSPPHEQATQVLDAVAKGVIPSDIGSTFILSIQAMLKIKEVTELEGRLKIIEENIESSK